MNLCAKFHTAFYSGMTGDLDMKNKVYIIGTGGFAAEITSYIESNKDVECCFEIIGYFDIHDQDYYKYKFSAPFLGNEKEFNFSRKSSLVIAISNSNTRQEVYSYHKNNGRLFPSVVHDTCFIGNNVSIGEGAILCPFVTITSNAKIGKNFQANIYSYVAHDCIIGDNVTFAPAVKCNGNVEIGDNVYIGTGAIIKQGSEEKPIRIGNNAVIGAGAYVLKDVPPGMTVFGSPAIEFTKENVKRRG